MVGLYRCHLQSSWRPIYPRLMDAPAMPIQMKADEAALLKTLLASARRYVEFGAGGSTCLAAQTVSESVIAVDSSREWLDKVAASCAANAYSVQPVLMHADIGELRDWGWPRDESQRAKWPAYHEAVWSRPEAASADTYMVDGRFRIACFMQIVLRCTPDAVIIIHDFSNRPNYGSVHMVAREIARASNLSAFIRRHDFDAGLASGLLEQHRFDAG